MKRFNIYSKFLFLAMAVIFAASCQDDFIKIDELLAESNTNKLSESAPTITGVYNYKDFMNNENPSPCVQAEMGQDLVVRGENLQGITSLLFHGIEIDAAEFYAQWDEIVLRVPYKLPEKGTADTMIVANKFGSNGYGVGLAIPDVKISGLNNEFQLPGRNIDIYGSYLTLCDFDGGNSKIYLENETEGYVSELSIVESSDDKVTVAIPSDVPDNSLITFEVAGEKLPTKFHYRPTNLLLVADEGSEVVPAVAANYSTIINGAAQDDIDNIFGETAHYYRFKGSIPGSTILLAFYVTDAFELEEGKEVTDYELVYEINTKEGCAIPKGNTYKFMVNNVGVNMWENYSKSEISTEGEWVTQRINFATVKASLTAAGDKQKFNIKLLTALPRADHSFANFRIQPINK